MPILPYIFSSTQHLALGQTAQMFLDLISLIASFEIMYYMPKMDTYSPNYALKNAPYLSHTTMLHQSSLGKELILKFSSYNTSSSG